MCGQSSVRESYVTSPPCHYADQVQISWQVVNMKFLVAQLMMRWPESLPWKYILLLCDVLFKDWGKCKLDQWSIQTDRLRSFYKHYVSNVSITWNVWGKINTASKERETETEVNATAPACRPVQCTVYSVHAHCPQHASEMPQFLLSPTHSNAALQQPLIHLKYKLHL